MSRFCKAYIAGKQVDVYCSGSWCPTIDKNPVLWIWDATIRQVLPPPRSYPDYPQSCFSSGHGMRQVRQPAWYVGLPGGQRTMVAGHKECAKWLLRHAVKETILSPYVLGLIDQAKRDKIEERRTRAIEKVEYRRRHVQGQ